MIKTKSWPSFYLKGLGLATLPFCVCNFSDIIICMVNLSVSLLLQSGEIILQSHQLPACGVALRDSSIISEPQVPHLFCGSNNNSKYIQLFWGLNVVVYIKHKNTLFPRQKILRDNCCMVRKMVLKMECFRSCVIWFMRREKKDSD